MMMKSVFVASVLTLAIGTAQAEQQGNGAQAQPQGHPPQGQQQPIQAPNGGQWVRVEGPSRQSGFPAAPGAPQPGVNPQMQSAFPQTNYGPANYAVAGQPAGDPQQQNGTAPLPPLNPPENDHFDEAMEVAQPFTPEQIKQMRQALENTRKAKAWQPVRGIPRISSVSVDLSPGASMPVLRVVPGELSNLIVLDSTGAPWPLAATPRVSNPDLYSAEWLQGTHTVVVSTPSAYETGSLALYLEGATTPVIVKIVSGEPDGKKDRARVYDARLDLRVPGRGPLAKAAVMGPGKIALYDDLLQAFLDGIPPKDAKQVKAQGAVPSHTQIWQYDGNLYVRTRQDFQTAFDNTLAAGDGTRVYRLPVTPFITLSQMGQKVTLQLDIY
ncbi:DotH/IcmK family type IV secretion protein [Pseudomonas putida]|uniref:DotH/IcmK family type IV secretion protein n=1 Tax=Pseudomonas putida TaxID=303 RepID=UPI00370C8958